MKTKSVNTALSELTNLQRVGIVGAMGTADSIKNLKADLKPGIHTFKVATLIEGTITKGFPSEQGRSGSVLTIGLLEHAYQLMDTTTRRQFTRAILKAANQTLLAPGKFDPELAEATKKEAGPVGLINKRILSKLPKGMSSGATKVECKVTSLDISSAEELAEDYQ